MLLSVFPSSLVIDDIGRCFFLPVFMVEPQNLVSSVCPARFNVGQKMSICERSKWVKICAPSHVCRLPPLNRGSHLSRLDNQRLWSRAECFGGEFPGCSLYSTRPETAHTFERKTCRVSRGLFQIPCQIEGAQIN